MLMLNIVLYPHQRSMWLGKLYQMDCPRSLHNHVPPTKSHFRRMEKHFCVHSVSMFCEYCDSFVITRFCLSSFILRY